jgi:hypothetical protein
MLDCIIIGGGIHGTYLSNLLTAELGYGFRNNTCRLFVARVLWTRAPRRLNQERTI